MASKLNSPLYLKERIEYINAGITMPPASAFVGVVKPTYFELDYQTYEPDAHGPRMKQDLPRNYDNSGKRICTVCSGAYIVLSRVRDGEFCNRCGRLENNCICNTVRDENTKRLNEYSIATTAWKKEYNARIATWKKEEIEKLTEALEKAEVSTPTTPKVAEPLQATPGAYVGVKHLEDPSLLITPYGGSSGMSTTDDFEGWKVFWEDTSAASSSASATSDVQEKKA